MMRVSAKEEKTHVCNGDTVTTKCGAPLQFLRPAFAGSDYALFALPCGVHSWIYSKSEITIEKDMPK